MSPLRFEPRAPWIHVYGILPHILLGLSTVKSVVRSEQTFPQVAYVCEFSWKQTVHNKMSCFPVVRMTYVV